jgi:Trypsin-like peptidase domain
MHRAQCTKGGPIPRPTAIVSLFFATLLLGPHSPGRACTAQPCTNVSTLGQARLALRIGVVRNGTSSEMEPLIRLRRRFARMSAQDTTKGEPAAALPSTDDKTSTNSLNIASDAARGVPTYGTTEGGPSVLLSNADGRNPYSSIVRYLGRAQCTGVFVATIPEDEDSGAAPAYVLTNGHCPAFPGANEVLVNQSAASNHRVIFNYFADGQTPQVSVAVTRIAYATMKGRDIAVLELAARYDDIVRSGFEPWPITLAVPARHEPVVVVGAPLTGSSATSFLRLAQCRLESRADVVLEFVWHWFDFDRNRCSDIREGSSGSPVISRQTGRLLGLLNTTTIGAVPFTDCFLNHPCEPVPGDVASQANTSYMTPLVRMDSCFDEGGQFDLRGQGCPLDADHQVRLTPAFLGAVNPRLTGTPLGSPRRRWGVTVSGMFDQYRDKVVAAASGDCRDLRGYGMSRRVTDHPVTADPLPQTEGYHFLCVLGGTGTRGGAAWQRIEHPTIVAIRIDMTPPRIPARISIREGDQSWTITFGALDPEISAYTFKFGRPSETRCEDPAHYRAALIPFITLSKVNRPYVFCAIPYDSAFNPGQTFEAILP